jgi:hypothetical protein
MISSQSNINRLRMLSIFLAFHFFVQLQCPGSIPHPTKLAFLSPISPPARLTISSASFLVNHTSRRRFNTSNSSNEHMASMNSSYRKERNSAPRHVFALGTSEMNKSLVKAVGWYVGGLCREGRRGFHRGGGADGRIT